MSITGTAFLLAFLTGLGLALFRHPIYGLYTYVAVFYIHPPSRWWVEALPDLRWSLVTAVVTLIATLRLPVVPGRAFWLKTAPAKALLLFAIWFWIQNLWAMEPEKHFEASVLFTKYVILYYVVYRLMTSPAEISGFLLAHLTGCFLLGCLAYNANFSGRLDGVGGPGIDDANSLGMQLATGVVVGAMVALAMPGSRRWYAIVALPFVLNGIILTGSRGAFLALVCGGFVLWMLKPTHYRALFYTFAALGVVLLGMLAHEQFWDRMETIKAAARKDESEADNSALSRWAIVEAQRKMAVNHPLGTGHRGTETLSPFYLDERYLARGEDGKPGRRSSHNTFMTAWVEQGIPGLILFVWLWGWSLVTVLRLRFNRHVAADPITAAQVASVAGGLAVVFVAGLFVDYIKAEVQVWLWALLASLAAAATRNELRENRGKAKTNSAMST